MVIAHIVKPRPGKIMKRISLGSSLLLLCLLLLPRCLSAQQQEMKETMRGLVDTVGFAHTKTQIEGVVSLSEDLEKDSLQAHDDEYNLSQHPWIAGVCPHDDYIYAGRVYVNLLNHIKARRVVLFGVAHRARNFNVEDRLIFDTFKTWRGPYGPVPVSSLREEILQLLPTEDYLVSDTIHSVEHSVEAIVPFLQYYNRNVEIVPILVPYMKWDRLVELSKRLAKVLGVIISKNHWVLGQDIAFVSSSDCVHYGDEGWGKTYYCPFGADSVGYDKAVAQEHDLISEHLVGEVNIEKVHDFFTRLVDQNDVKTYKITWCGRFSVPFGLACSDYLMKELKEKPLVGRFLRYGTSVSFGRLPIENMGMGVTAPGNLHHWVGYVAVGYF